MNKKINWCCKQKKGIELIEPNENLKKEYLKEARETLEEVVSRPVSRWSVIMAYYACYHALYAILMKAGIKSEIHDCTIELLRIIEGFNEEDYIFLSTLKEKRIRAQYYLKHEVIDDLDKVKQFILRCEAVAENSALKSIRGKIKNAEK